jgi:hypothetical protein
MNPEQILSEQAEAGSHKPDFTGSSQDRHGPGGSLQPEHRDHLAAELGADGLALAEQLGARTIDAPEAARLGFRYKGWAGGGLLLPFGNGFAQLRCDNPPTSPAGDPVKYLNRAGGSQAPLTIGTGKPTAATEGFKDAVRLHLATGETVQAIAGVTSWRSLAPSVAVLIYDADAQHNPSVWVQLIRAGLERRTMRLAFFPADTAGPKGGACEFFGAGGDLAAVRRWKARELLRELPAGWTRTMRADWQARSVRCLAMLATEAGMDRTAAEQLAAAGAKAIGMPTRDARSIARRVATTTRARPVTVPPNAPPDRQLVAAAGEPPAGAVNAGSWATALGRGIGARLRRNLLSQEVELDGQPLRGESEELLYVTAQQAGWEIRRADCYDGTRAVSLKNAYHPVREYLDRITADPAINPADLDTIAARYLGVTDPLSAAMVRCLLIGAVARVHQPGCEAPGVVVLRGDQGIGKSRFWQALGGPFYVASRHDDGARDQAMAMHRSWFYDLDELDKITTAKQAAGLRSLITTPADTFRLPYARKEESFPRQFVIVGAVNGDGFLTDPEGNRRYWVIDCPQAKDSGQFIDGPAAARDRDAIWKAAALAYRAGAAWTLTTGQQAASNVRNGQWEAIDEWQAALAGWAESVVTPGGFTTREAITGAGLRINESINRVDEMRAAACLKRAGFERQTNPTRRPDGRRERFWVLAQPGTTCLEEVVPAESRSSAVDLPTLAQPGTTCLEEVVPAESRSSAVDLPTLAQPAQPVWGYSRETTTGGIGGEKKSVHINGLGVSGCAGCADLPRSVPVQPITAGTTSGTTSEFSPEVVPAPIASPPVGTSITVDGQHGWRLPGAMPKGDGQTVKVLVQDPQGRSRQVERRQIALTTATKEAA